MNNIASQKHTTNQKENEPLLCALLQVLRSITIAGMKMFGKWAHKLLLRKHRNRISSIRALGKEIASAGKGDIRVIIGSGSTRYPGWISTDVGVLNLLREEDWLRLFAPNSIASILAEHVWEHLSESEGSDAALRCCRYMRPGGRLRIAVPDGYRPDPEYQAAIAVGGTGPGANSHKIVYNQETLSKLLSTSGFRPVSLEYFDRDGVFHSKNWSSEDGHIRRSLRHDRRNQNGKVKYTSLIVDGIKS